MDDDTIMEPPFATVTDLEQRWHTLTDEESEQAQTLLDDASLTITALQPHWRQLDAGLLRMVTCNIVKRAMTTGSDGMPAGVTQYNQTTGSFTDGYTFANPTGDLYLTATEKKLLGVGVQRAYRIDMATGKARP